MILAIPLTGTTLTKKLGNCDSYAFVRVNPEENTVLETTMQVAPPHAPDHLPDWIVKMGAKVVIVPEMTDRIRGLFEYHGLDVILGLDRDTPEALAEAFLALQPEDPSLN